MTEAQGARRGSGQSLQKAPTRPPRSGAQGSWLFRKSTSFNPYAGANRIRFEGFPRRPDEDTAVSQPLAGDLPETPNILAGPQPRSQGRGARAIAGIGDSSLSGINKSEVRRAANAEGVFSRGASTSGGGHEPARSHPNHSETLDAARVIGPKSPLKPGHIWSIGQELKSLGAVQALAMFIIALDAKLRGCDLVELLVADVARGNVIRQRSTIVQRHQASALWPLAMHSGIHARPVTCSLGTSMWMRSCPAGYQTRKVAMVSFPNRHFSSTGSL